MAKILAIIAVVVFTFAVATIATAATTSKAAFELDLTNKSLTVRYGNKIRIYPVYDRFWTKETLVMVSTFHFDMWMSRFVETGKPAIVDILGHVEINGHKHELGIGRVVLKDNIGEDAFDITSDDIITARW